MLHVTCGYGCPCSAHRIGLKKRCAGGGRCPSTIFCIGRPKASSVASVADKVIAWCQLLFFFPEGSDFQNPRIILAVFRAASDLTGRVAYLHSGLQWTWLTAFALCLDDIMVFTSHLAWTATVLTIFGCICWSCGKMLFNFFDWRCRPRLTYEWRNFVLL